jgi:hypothetical protein
MMYFLKQSIFREVITMADRKIIVPCLFCDEGTLAFPYEGKNNIPLFVHYRPMETAVCNVCGEELGVWTKSSFSMMRVLKKKEERPAQSTAEGVSSSEDNACREFFDGPRSLG